LGYNVGYENIAAASYNTLIGYQTGINLDSGYGNILIGADPDNCDQCGFGSDITSGRNNIGIGYNLRFGSGTANNQLNIGNFLFGTLPATSSAQKLVAPITGSFGVATSSPFATFGIHANNGSTNTTLFAIGSSTVTATTTLFTVDNVGNAYFAGNVGVGTTSPQATFAVQAPASETKPALYVHNMGSSEPVAEFVLDKSSAQTDLSLVLDNQSASNETYFQVSNLATAANAWMFGVDDGSTSFALDYGGRGEILNPLLNVTTAGFLGLGSSTPWAQLSINPDGIGTGPAFAIGSSTRTLFSVSNTGAASTTQLFGAGLATCNGSNALTWNSGLFGCSSVGSAAFPFTPTTAFGTAANATSTLIGFTNGIYATASSTIGDSTQQGGLTINGGATTTGNAYFAGNLNIATTAPMNVSGVLLGSGAYYAPQAGYLFANSTNTGMIEAAVGDLRLTQNGSTVLRGAGAQLQLAKTTIGAIGVVSPATGTNLTVWGGNAGMGSTSAMAKLSVHAAGTDTNQYLFAIGSSTQTATTTLFTVDNRGYVSVGTTSPSAYVAINPDGIGSDNAFAIGSSTKNLFSVSNTGNTIIGGTGQVGTGGSGINFTVLGGTLRVVRTAVGDGSINVMSGGINLSSTGFLALFSNSTERARFLSTGQYGLGTSSPFALSSIHANNGDTNQYLFAIGSSTQTATNTKTGDW
jgi:hypothetical protein